MKEIYNIFSHIHIFVPMYSTANTYIMHVIYKLCSCEQCVRHKKNETSRNPRHSIPSIRNFHISICTKLIKYSTLKIFGLNFVARIKSFCFTHIEYCVCKRKMNANYIIISALKYNGNLTLLLLPCERTKDQMTDFRLFLHRPQLFRFLK